MKPENSRKRTPTSGFKLLSRMGAFLCLMTGLLSIGNLGRCQDAISWTGSQISGPSDVINNGSLVMAYMLGNPNENFTVNGVTFASDPGGVLTNATGSVTIDPSITSPAPYVFGYTNHFGQTNADGTFTAYGLMISSGRWENDVTVPISISGLTPGQTYLIELWDGDDRGNGGQVETFSDTTTAANSIVMQSQAGPQIAVGSFTASGSNEVITMSGEAQINALQLRQSAPITWLAPVPITTADATLTVPGNVAGAYTVAGAEAFGNTETVVTLSNGTNIDFKNDGSVAIAIGSSGNGPAYGALNGTATSGTNTTGNADFDTVLNGFNYGNGPRVITLNNLIPGQKYVVQLFALDDRTGYVNPPLRQAYYQDPLNTANISSTFTMGANESVMGMFTAASTTQTIVEQQPGNSGGGDVGAGNINALVVYQVTSPVRPVVTWLPPVPITTADATLTVPGNVAGAYAVAGAEAFGNTETVVTLSNGTNIDFKNDGSVAIAIGSSGNGPAYGALNGTATSGTNTTGNADFDTVLNGFNYGNGPRTITLNNLIPGQKYAVQLFALDDRWGYVYPPLRQAYYQDPSDPANASGEFTMATNVSVMGVFTAVSTTQNIIEQQPGNSSGGDLGAGNINALVVYQVTAPPALPVLSVSNLRGGQLQLSWTGGGALQSQTNTLSAGLGTNWVNYPGSSPVTVTIAPLNGSVFFRVKQ